MGEHTTETDYPLTEALARVNAAERLVRRYAEAAVAGGGLESWSDDMHFLLQDTWGNHVAAWQPFAALAVADWLRTAGADLWAHGPLCCADGCDACDDSLWMPHARRALALADVVLPPASREPVCTICGATDDQGCVETDGGCCEGCRATGGCSHESESDGGNSPAQERPS